MFFIIPLPSFIFGRYRENSPTEVRAKLALVLIAFIVGIGVLFGVKFSGGNSYSGSSYHYNKLLDSVDNIVEADEGVAFLVFTTFEVLEDSEFSVYWKADGKFLGNGNLYGLPLFSSSTDGRFRAYTKEGESKMKNGYFRKEIDAYLVIEFGSTKQDSGIYSVTMTAGYTTITRDHLVIFKDSGPEKYAAAKGKRLKLPCGIGISPVKSTWTKNGQSILSSSDRISVARFRSKDEMRLFESHDIIERVFEISELDFNTTTLDDTGFYSCNLNSGQIYMQQDYQVVVVEKEDPISSPFGGMSPCSCNLTLDEPQTLIWKRNEIPFMTSNLTSEFNSSKNNLGKQEYSSDFSIGRYDDRFVNTWRNVTCSAVGSHWGVTMEVVTWNEETYAICSFVDKSKPVIYWTKDATEHIPSNTEVLVNSVTYGNDMQEIFTLLYFSNATEKDSGNYSCVMHSKTSEKVSGTVYINFTVPEIATVEVRVNQTAALECVEKLSIEYPHEWTKNGTVLDEDNERYKIHYRIVNMKDRKISMLFSPRLQDEIKNLKTKKSYPKSYLLISNAEEEDTGIYKCNSSNRRIHLKVLPANAVL